MDFKAGDSVKCIKEEDTFDFMDLKLGEVYTVLKAEYPMVQIINSKHLESWYNYTRFVSHISTRISKASARMYILNQARKLRCLVEFIEQGDNYMMVRFTSDSFAVVPAQYRHEIIYHTFKTNCPQLIEQYELLFDAHTPLELISG